MIINNNDHDYNKIINEINKLKSHQNLTEKRKEKKNETAKNPNVSI